MKKYIYFLFRKLPLRVSEKRVFTKIGVLRGKLPGEIHRKNPCKIPLTKFNFRKTADSQSATLFFNNFDCNFQNAYFPEHISVAASIIHFVSIQ